LGSLTPLGVEGEENVEDLTEDPRLRKGTDRRAKTGTPDRLICRTAKEARKKLQLMKASAARLLLQDITKCSNARIATTKCPSGYAFYIQGQNIAGILSSK